MALRKTLAMVQTARRRLEPRELPVPDVRDDTAILRVEACGICGSDYEQYEGVLRTPMPVIPGHEPLGRIEAIGDAAARRWGVDVCSYSTAPVADALDFAAPGGTVVLAGVKGWKAIPDFVSDKIVIKEIRILGAIGVTSSGYRKAIALLEARRYPVERMHTHDFGLRDAELAIRTLAREIPGEESIHSCLLPTAEG